MGDATDTGDRGGAVTPGRVPAAPLTDVLQLLGDVAVPADDEAAAGGEPPGPASPGPPPPAP